MTREELKNYLQPDEVYEITQDAGQKWIIKYERWDGEYLRHKGYIYNKEHSKEGSWGNESHIKDIKIASLLDKLHMEKCLKANKYVPKPLESELEPQFLIFN